MRKVNSNYPLGQALIETLNRSGLKLSAFLASIGYSNINKGIRAFEQALTTGKVPQILLERIMQSDYALSTEQLQRAIEANQELLAKEELAANELKRAAAERDFRPYIMPVTESKRPSSITIFYLIGGIDRLRIDLPSSFATWELPLQYGYAQAQIRSHYQSTKGVAPLLGAITGYHLFREYGQPPLMLTIDGQVIGTDPEGKTISVTLTLSRRKEKHIPPNFL
jgi:hypothetical protein